MTALVTTETQNTIPANLVEVAEAAKGYIEESTSTATRKAYRSDYKIFSAWCEKEGCQSLPASPEVVTLFLTVQASAGVSASTLNRRLAAIKFRHEGAGFESPTKAKLVVQTLKGIRRAVGSAKSQKTPATSARVLAMVEQCPDTVAGLRDKAILLLGFAGAFRRSELAALTVADIETVQEGLRVTIRKSKTDQEGIGHTIAIYNGGRMQVVKALNDWLAVANISDGFIFRPVSTSGSIRSTQLTDKSIAEIVKKYARLAGLDPAEFSGHSLRAGFLTSAAEAGANIFKMMEVSRHKSVDTVKGYVRMAELFKDHAGSSFL